MVNGGFTMGVSLMKLTCVEDRVTLSVQLYSVAKEDLQGKIRACDIMVTAQV